MKFPSSALLVCSFNPPRRIPPGSRGGVREKNGDEGNAVTEADDANDQLSGCDAFLKRLKKPNSE
jgi:hypothetical protein